MTLHPLLLLFFLVLGQNASFTLVSRARNSDNYLYHGLAAVLSNGFWLLVIRVIVIKIDEWPTQLTYLAGAVTGSVLMHWFSRRFLEKKKPSLTPVLK